MVAAPDKITITGLVKALERDASNGAEAQAPLVRSSDRERCDARGLEPLTPAMHRDAQRRRINLHTTHSDFQK